MQDVYSTVGITLAICGNILINIALNIQRYAHNLQQRKHERLRRRQNGSHVAEPNYLKSRLWWIGAIIMTIGETGNFVAYGFAPASVVSPLGVFSLVSNCIVAPVFFHEKVRKRNFVGVAMAIVGILFITLSVEGIPGVQKPPDPIGTTGVPYDAYQSIMQAITQKSFKIYSIIMVGLALTILAFVDTSGPQAHKLKSLFANIFLVAIFGAYTALATKGLSGLLSFTFAKALSYYITYILIAVIAVTAVCQIIFLNRALQNFDATVVVPTHFVMFTISVITGSAVVFHDFEEKSPGQLASFFVGCILTFIGVWLITWRGPDSSPSPSSAKNAGTRPSVSSHSHYSHLVDHSIVNFPDVPHNPPSSRGLSRANSTPSSLCEGVFPSDEQNSVEATSDTSLLTPRWERPHLQSYGSELLHHPLVRTRSESITHPALSSLPATGSGLIGTMLSTKRSNGSLRTNDSDA
uniref:ARAD1B23276p n=1 Tax=Blastobotrys adeninivorans TaxID=409370 RepID=A0A060TDB3_BLAAD